MVRAAAAGVLGPGACVLDEVILPEALALAEEDSQIVQLILNRGDPTKIMFQIASLRAAEEDEPASWRMHATGRVRVEATELVASIPQHGSFEEVRARCLEQLSGEDFYKNLYARGYQFGPSFQGIVKLWRRDGEALGQVQLPTELASQVMNYQIHPALL